MARLPNCRRCAPPNPPWRSQDEFGGGDGLRDSLFEFFAEKDVYRKELRDELELHDSQWEQALAGGPAEAIALVAHPAVQRAPRAAPVRRSLSRRRRRPVSRGEDPTLDDASFLSRCLSLGKQYRLQRLITNPESVSKVLFETALRLARNRGLADADVPNLAERRRAFAEEISSAIRRVDIIDALAASRRAGAIDERGGEGRGARVGLSSFPSVRPSPQYANLSTNLFRNVPS
jgi:glycerol-3-phosphate O-acyltransferase